MQSTTRLAQALYNIQCNNPALRAVYIAHLLPYVARCNACRCIEEQLFTYDPAEDAAAALKPPLFCVQHHVDLLCVFVHDWAVRHGWAPDVQQQVAQTVEKLCAYEATMACVKDAAARANHSNHVLTRLTRLVHNDDTTHNDTTPHHHSHHRTHVFAQSLFAIRIIRNQ